MTTSAPASAIASADDAPEAAAAAGCEEALAVEPEAIEHAQDGAPDVSPSERPEDPIYLIIAAALNVEPLIPARRVQCQLETRSGRNQSGLLPAARFRLSESPGPAICREPAASRPPESRLSSMQADGCACRHRVEMRSCD